MTWRRYLITTATILVPVSLSILGLFNRRNQVVGFYQKVQDDDCAFSVSNVRKANTFNDAAGQIAESKFYAVTLRIANQVRRVNYAFKKSAAILGNDRGKNYPLSEPGKMISGKSQLMRAVANQKPLL
jgi:hypothetical protein